MITNYFVLLVLATVIATLGVTSNSDATVIGAMIIAPLMTPIMGTAFSIVTGSPHQVWHSLVLVVVSVMVVVTLSLLLARLVPNYQLSFTSNVQITSRTSPNLIALIIALAAGAAGGYSTTHKEIADSLPGVAIAISLVPPLSVVGIALSRGQWGDAQGSFLLFITNFLAILLAGGAIFWMLHVDVALPANLNTAFRRRAFTAVVISSVLLAGILLGLGVQTARQAIDQQTANIAVQQWLGAAQYDIQTVSVDQSTVEVTIAGQGTLGSLDSLSARLGQALRRPVRVRLQVEPVQEYRAQPVP